MHARLRRSRTPTSSVPTPTPLLLLLAVAAAAATVGSVHAATGDKNAPVCRPKYHNLPPDGRLQIGIRHRPERCELTAQKGKELKVLYTGFLYRDCTEFDSNAEDRSKPYEFSLGKGMVIRGWEKGLIGACIGEKRKLVVPSNLAYGEQGAGDLIPGGATLVYEIEVLSISK